MLLVPDDLSVLLFLICLIIPIAKTGRVVWAIDIYALPYRIRIAEQTLIKIQIMRQTIHRVVCFLQILLNFLFHGRFRRNFAHKIDYL